MKVAVIGQGYVGLPVSVNAAMAGHSVIGFDINLEVVEGLNSGKSHISDINSTQIAQLIQSGSYAATSDPDLLADIEVAVIAVPTPLNSERNPDLEFLLSASKILGTSLKKSTLIINESTSYPGTLRNLISTEVNKYVDSDIQHLFAVSPERVDPGNNLWKIKNTPRLLSGLTEEATALAFNFYSSFCEKIILVDSPEIAETAKLFENTFRQVNIALVNELSQITHSLNIPINKVIEAAASKPYGFMKFNPGLGVGGHCIPVDPTYLAFSALNSGIETKFINLANEVNFSQPKLIAKRICLDHGGSLSGKKVLICGVAYKANISDTRESPAELLVQSLEGLGAKVLWHDPLVKSWNGQSSTDVLGSTFDIVIVNVFHDSMDLELIKKAGTYIFDLSGRISGAIYL